MNFIRRNRFKILVFALIIGILVFYGLIINPTHPEPSAPTVGVPPEVKHESDVLRQQSE
jgi:hypothetical protein